MDMDQLGSTHKTSKNKTRNPHVSSDCVARTALLVYRGIGAGVAWSIAVDGYAIVGYPMSFWNHRLDLQQKAVTRSNVVREMFSAWSFQTAKNCLGFGTFLGIFGGVSCLMERTFGKNDVLNPFIGGCTAGLVLVPGGARNFKRLAVTSLACGIASVGFQLLIPSGGEDESKR